MRFGQLLPTATRERPILVYVPDLDGVARTGLSSADFSVALLYAAEGTSAYVDLSASGVTVTEVDDVHAAGWYEVRVTPYGAGRTLVMVTPTFDGNAGPQGFVIDSRAVIGAEPSKFLVVYDDDGSRYHLPVYSGTDM